MLASIPSSQVTQAITDSDTVLNMLCHDLAVFPTGATCSAIRCTTYVVHPILADVQQYARRTRTRTGLDVAMYYQFLTDDAWQNAVTLIEKKLIDHIRNGNEPMTYTELVNHINPEIARRSLDLNIEGDRSALSALLGDVSGRCRNRHEPMLSTFVVLKDTQMPEYGWWEQARLAGHPIDTDNQRILAFTKEYQDCKYVYGKASYTYGRK